MKLTNVLTLNALLLLVFGIACALYGPLIAAFFGVPDLPMQEIDVYWAIVSFIRLFGAALFGFGILLWAARSIFAAPNNPEVRRGVLFALLLAHLFATVIVLVQQWSVWNTLAGWVALILFACFGAAYAYFLFTRPQSWQTPAAGPANEMTA
ncbi:MAG TPA: hypothetical protein VLS48_07180 [Anaerolineales bacterium]|nr:hypothetical protein [Anaerolineales bacterium]